MSLFRKVLAGIATGAGTYLTEKAKADAQAARDELLHNRERALQAIKKQDSMDVNEQAGRITRENTAFTAREQRVTNAQTGQIQAANAAADDTRDQGHAERMARLNAALTAQNNAASTRLQAQITSGNIIDTVQDADGNWIGITKDGKTKPLGIRSNLPESADGVLPAPKAEGGGSLSDYRPGVGSGQPAAAQPIPDNFRTRWMNATADKTPGLFRGQQKIPLEEAWRLYQGN